MPDSGEVQSIAGAERRVELVLDDAAALRAEYARNLHKGGAFVPTREPFEMREVVEVSLRAPFCGLELVLPAEVVLCLAPEVAPPGAEPGIAVQFLAPVEDVRARLDPVLAEITGSGAAADAPVAPTPPPQRSDDDDLAAAQKLAFGAAPRRRKDPLLDDLAGLDAEASDGEEAPLDLLDEIGPEDGDGTPASSEAGASAPDVAPGGPPALPMDGPADGRAAAGGPVELDPGAFDPAGLDGDGTAAAPTAAESAQGPAGAAGGSGGPEPTAPPRLTPRPLTSPFHDERRDSRREHARIPVRVRTTTGQELEARTRDLSRSGVLLTVEGAELPVGRRIHLELTNPQTGEVLRVDGRVVRHIESEGTVPAAAVRFEPALGQAADVTRFVEELQALEEQRTREGIRGPIEEMGVAGLLQMLASCGPRGTVTLARGHEEGTVIFEGGQLRAVRLGSVGGVKALARLVAWPDGEFEFRSHVDEPLEDEEMGPLDAALLEALRRIDEEKRLAVPVLPPESKLGIDTARLANITTPPGKLAQAVLDLAAAGFTMRRILDVIPEPDGDIRAAVADLVERGVVKVTDPA